MQNRKTLIQDNLSNALNVTILHTEHFLESIQSQKDRQKLMKSKTLRSSLVSLEKRVRFLCAFIIVMEL